MRSGMTSNPWLELLGTGELRALCVGWFLWAPTALLVPALGWIGAPLGPRLALGFGLSLCVLPEVSPQGELWLDLARALGLGVSVAVGAGAVLWAALMVGGIADRLRTTDGALDDTELLPTGPLALLFGLLTALFFLAGGGPARVGAALARLGEAPHPESARAIVDACTASITLAVTVATPVLLTALLLETLSALLQRSAAPLVAEALLRPLTALAFLFLLAVALGPLLEALGGALG